MEFREFVNKMSPFGVNEDGSVGFFFQKEEYERREKEFKREIRKWLDVPGPNGERFELTFVEPVWDEVFVGYGSLRVYGKLIEEKVEEQYESEQSGS